MAPITSVPPEILSRILELATDDADWSIRQKTLCAAALVHSAWTPTARRHLVAFVWIQHAEDANGFVAHVRDWGTTKSLMLSNPLDAAEMTELLGVARPKVLEVTPQASIALDVDALCGPGLESE